jgi:drug/metabolite transporter (DMT)-like permease
MNSPAIVARPFVAHRWADLALLLVAVVWGASYGLAKTAVLYYPVLGFLAIRFGVTAILLAPTWVRMPWARAKKALRAGVPLGVILTATIVAETYGVSMTMASNAAFLISMCVVFTPFAEWAVMRVRPGASSFIAAAVSLAGTWLLTSGISLAFNLGDALMMLASVIRAFLVAYTGKLTRDATRDIDDDHDVPTGAFTAVQSGTAGLCCLVLAIVVLPGGLPPLPTAPAFWSATAFLIVFCTLFALAAQNYALKHATPTRVSLLMGSEPLFGAFFAVLWLGESLSPSGWCGGLLIVGASIWAASGRRMA